MTPGTIFGLALVGGRIYSLRYFSWADGTGREDPRRVVSAKSEPAGIQAAKRQNTADHGRGLGWDRRRHCDPWACLGQITSVAKFLN